MRVKPLITIPLIAIALAGCSAQPPTSKETTSATEQKPLFATDAEALAAAEAAYANYLEVSDQIARDGGANPERLKGLVSDALYSEQLSAYKELQSSGIHAGGSTAMDHFRIQNFSNLASGGTFTTYVCLDVSSNPVLDSQGSDVTPNNRQSRIPLSIGFVGEGSKSLIINSSEVWTGTNFC